MGDVSRWCLTFRAPSPVCNASPSLNKSDLNKAATGCTGFKESVSLSFLICWSNKSFLVDFLPPDEFQNGPFIPHHRGLVCCVCVLVCYPMSGCVYLCVGQCQGAKQHIKTVTGRSHLVFNFTRVSSHL